MVLKDYLNMLHKLKAEGFSEESQRKMLLEMEISWEHRIREYCKTEALPSLEHATDFGYLQRVARPRMGPDMALQGLDEILRRDAQREKDGYPKKVKLRGLTRPSKDGKHKVIIVPMTHEEKFYHIPDAYPEDDDGMPQDGDSGETGGAGDGDEGEVIHEEPLNPDDGEGNGAGSGEGGEHGIESNAYDLGRILTEKFSLPNIKEKRKKKSVPKWRYELTDTNRREGLILDKKQTLRNIVKTNIGLGRLDPDKLDTSGFLVSPKDKVYRILSKEREYESQALVFFLRDYSGSMMGPPTEVTVQQHLMIYSWLAYQYQDRVQTRFVVHDTQAKEVKDFHEYYNIMTGGGTAIISGYKLINKIVREENLARDYNIYIFQGTDGDDWNKDGAESIEEVEEMLTYVNRMGITVVPNMWGGGDGESDFESYMKGSGLLKKHPDLIRLDRMDNNADDDRIIAGIKYLISE
ncbi:MAG: DUF444 family protein [Candidatus Woesearchaeota archaeon]